MMTAHGPQSYESLPSHDGGPPTRYTYRDPRAPVVTHHPIPYLTSDGAPRRGQLIIWIIVLLLLTVAVMLGALVGLTARRPALPEVWSGLQGYTPYRTAGLTHDDNSNVTYTNKDGDSKNTTADNYHQYPDTNNGSSYTGNEAEKETDGKTSEDINGVQKISTDWSVSSKNNDSLHNFYYTTPESISSNRDYETSNYGNQEVTYKSPSTPLDKVVSDTTHKPSTTPKLNITPESSKPDYLETTTKPDWLFSTSAPEERRTETPWWDTTDYRPIDPGSDTFDTNMSFVDYMVVMQKRVPVGVMLAMLVMTVLLTLTLLGAIIWVLRRRSNATRRRDHVRRAIDELRDHDKGLLNSDDEEV